MKICICSLDRREIVRPKRYMTTSSSDKEQVITSRDKSQSNETIDFESNFREIRDALTINKENEAANVNWPIEHTSSRTMNSPSLQSVNPTTQSNNTNTTSTLEQSSVPEKTYIELLPSNLTQGLNICTTNRYISIYTNSLTSSLYVEHTANYTLL